MVDKDFITPTELAKIIGVSRTAINKRIKKGDIPAQKVGRYYVIPSSVVGGVNQRQVSDRQKKKIDAAVHLTVKEFGDALRLLGQE